jgi:hypothetical protein
MANLTIVKCCKCGSDITFTEHGMKVCPPKANEICMPCENPRLFEDYENDESNDYYAAERAALRAAHGENF